MAAGTASLSPVVTYHGLARRYLMPSRFLMRPQLNAGTLGGRNSREHSSRAGVEAGREIRRRHICNRPDDTLGVCPLP